MARSLRLLVVPAPDVRDLLLGSADGGGKLEEDLEDALSPTTTVNIIKASPRGWAGTLEDLDRRTAFPDLGPHVFLTSVSSEVADPSPRPVRALTELSRRVQAAGGRGVVLNASTLTPGENLVPGRLGDAEPLHLQIRRLNLAAMEASHATGLSVLDADRLVAQASLSHKVAAPFDYAPEVCETIRSALISVLEELGFAERFIMEARVPFVPKVTKLTVRRWIKAEGDSVAEGDVLCELGLDGVTIMTRPTSAMVLASIRRPGIRSLFSRERVKRRSTDAVVSVVARDTAHLREIVRPAGAQVRVGDRLAVLSRGRDMPISRSAGSLHPFPAVLRTDDPTLDHLL